MSIIINEFEIVTEPPASPEAGAQRSPENRVAEDPVRVRPDDIVRVMKRQVARVDRVRPD